MQLPGGWELIIILIFVLVLFRPGRISKISGELGRSIREFRSGLQGDDEENETPSPDDS